MIVLLRWIWRQARSSVIYYSLYYSVLITPLLTFLPTICVLLEREKCALWESSGCIYR